MDYEILIIGGGVVGLSCASRLSGAGHRIVLAERHPAFGMETSSRNSEVIHAGIYYPTGSLKAKLCVPGNRHLYEWCESHRVPNRRIGKYIVAVNESETGELDRIFTQGKANGAEGLSRCPLSKLRNEEPYVRAVEALWSRDTGIIDSHLLMSSLEAEAIDHGCDFAWRHKVGRIDKISGGFDIEMFDPEGNIFSLKAEKIINAAGLDSDLVAEGAGIDIDEKSYRLHYCRGHYFRAASSKKHLASHLIYPTPGRNASGLGIHVTLDLNGELKLGPDTEYLDKREQDYSVPESLKTKFHQAVSAYLPGIGIDDISPDQSGIRPKLQPKGGGFRDFIIKDELENGLPGLINLIGIESPGLTCCLEIADLVATLAV